MSMSISVKKIVEERDAEQVQSSNKSEWIATDDSFDLDDLKESCAGPVTSYCISK